MLLSLSIRDFVLIDALDLEFGAGFTSLTGETGAGKSILLDALGLALGQTTSRGQVRSSAEKAVITAVFDPPADHPSRAFLRDRDYPAADELIVLRRTVPASGAARAYINDAPASAGALSDLGALLIEIHGQNSHTGLMHPTRHRSLLDAFAGAEGIASDTASAWRDVKAAREARDALKAELAATQAERSFVQHALEELEALAPVPGEVEKLSAERAFLQNFEKLLEALDDAEAAFDGAKVDEALARGLRSLERALSAPGLRAADDGDGAAFVSALEAARAAFDRALIEAEEAMTTLGAARRQAAFEPDALDRADARLSALRQAARKHSVTPEALPELMQNMRNGLDRLGRSDEALADAETAVAHALKAYDQAAGRLSEARTRAGGGLSDAVAEGLGPLKMEKARFQVRLAPLDADKAGVHGREKVAFEVSTNPGAPFGPLQQIASGGELARFALALKVALAEAGPAQVLIFDEADQGVGGAVAAAVGERLSALSVVRQVLAVTHSPQVAARADAQLRVSKDAAGDAALTRIERLSEADRREEIARMLSAAEVTNEARAAADALLAAKAG